MRKNTFTLAALTLLAGATVSTAASAQSADFSWYGRIDLGLENNSNGAITRNMVQNFASRLGIRGERKLGDISAIFQVETGVAPDDTAQSRAFANRNSFVGIKSARLGTALIGTFDMPLKALEGTTGGMWGEGDLVEILVHGKATSTTVGSSAFANVHTRKTNVLHYASPKVMNMVAKLAYSPDEAKVAATGGVPEYARAMFGASLEYNDGTFNGGVAWQQQDNFTAPTATVGGKTMKAAKATLGAKMDAWSAGLAYSVISNSVSRKTTNYTLTGAYAVDTALSLKATFGASSESASGAQDGVSGMALQADYALDKQVSLYTYFARLNNGAKAKGSLVAADNFPAVGTAGDDPRALGVGVRYNF